MPVGNRCFCRVIYLGTGSCVSPFPTLQPPEKRWWRAGQYVTQGVCRVDGTSLEWHSSLLPCPVPSHAAQAHPFPSRRREGDDQSWGVSLTLSAFPISKAWPRRSPAVLWTVIITAQEERDAHFAKDSSKSILSSWCSKEELRFHSWVSQLGSTSSNPFTVCFGDV